MDPRVGRRVARRPAPGGGGDGQREPRLWPPPPRPGYPRPIPACWLIKSEPFKYPWSKLVANGRAVWDGVCNFEARNNLRAMAEGYLVLFYHSNEGKEIVGVSPVIKTAFQDPTTPEDWSVVEVAPVAPLARPLSLAAIKADPALATMALLRRSRLSVTPVTAPELAHILATTGTVLPKRRAG